MDHALPFPLILDRSAEDSSSITRTAGRKLEKWGMWWTGILQLNFTTSHWDLASAFGCAWVLSVTYLLPDDLLYCLTPVTSARYTKSTRFRQKPTDMNQQTWTEQYAECTKRIKKDQTGIFPTSQYGRLGPEMTPVLCQASWRSTIGGRPWALPPWRSHTAEAAWFWGPNPRT